MTNATTDAVIGAGGRPGVEASDDAYHEVEHQLAVLFRRAHALSAEMSRRIHPELDPGAYGLLIFIGQGDPVRPSDLAAHLGVGKATISRQLKVLGELGLVTREPDPDDGRAHLLALTDEGRQRLENARTARQRRFRALLDSWPEDEVRSLARMLARFNNLTREMTEV
ncbi:MarR family transcriptional regulator [Microbispora corallina]|uniref:Transcriptional regulator n=1 Tax=Microbispora corallina TaxID=83302 RepID=A0ABQ4FVH3_9ACTN|nr:MarR family winged helix-turn-helix transcriptional regulator [Microbispora corallina]GIH38781.1 transcriptional regulator [Microbispora corallina]